jgi:hypothetical protein
VLNPCFKVALILTRFSPSNLCEVLNRLKKRDSNTFRLITQELPKAFKLSSLTSKITREFNAKHSQQTGYSTSPQPIVEDSQETQSLSFKHNIIIRFEDEF